MSHFLVLDGFGPYLASPCRDTCFLSLPLILSMCCHIHSVVSAIIDIIKYTNHATLQLHTCLNLRISHMSQNIGHKYLNIIFQKIEFLHAHGHINLFITMLSKDFSFFVKFIYNWKPNNMPKSTSLISLCLCTETKEAI